MKLRKSLRDPITPSPTEVITKPNAPKPVEIATAPNPEKPAEPNVQELEKAFRPSKSTKIFLGLGILFLLSGTALGVFAFLLPPKTLEAASFPHLPSTFPSDKTLSILTGEELSSPELNNSPIFCVQTPNGTDGARPQAGLDQAGVVFEAIAERGITRFAAIYQNPTSAVVGPIRSLRMYYLEWDTPFGCAIVHAGGADDAIAALRQGGYRELDENYVYMYRGTLGNRLWNNLFTTASYLKKFATDNNFTTAQPKGFTRLTPIAATKARYDNLAVTPLDIITPTDQNTSVFTPKAAHISFNFASSPNYNVVYDYDPETNTYKRGYASGLDHTVYHCPAEELGEVNPENNCKLIQLAPTVVIAMIVQQATASDGYHENITAVGQNTAYIFQNGTVIKGSWHKNTREEQIKFFDDNGAEVALVPGQTFISAVPTYGAVEYQ